MSSADALAAFADGNDPTPRFVRGEALEVLRGLPDACVDMCLTSPPYWGQREYTDAGIGLEARWRDYVDALVNVMAQVARVLRPTGSLWLNLGDAYVDKALLGLPWRVAMAMSDQGDWILRNDVVWHKIKGAPDQSRDKLRNVHEHVFHFVRQRRGYFYDVDAIRSAPRRATVKNGSVVSATGVSGVRYRRQIELSTALGEDEKAAATRALDAMLDGVAKGELSDFRMVIRGQQRTTHSNATRVSGRARELRDRGFYFLRYHPKGAKPSDVWDILPEDTHGRATHFAPFPEDLCRIPILATCPPRGLVLDPFCGTGTTAAVAQSLGRRSLGIDLSDEYLEIARARVNAAPTHASMEMTSRG